MATDRPAKTDVNLRQAGPDIKQILANLRKSPKAKQKKVSPKSRRTAELYKSSHNIGNRTAAERVGSYKESEVAVVYPEGFWDVARCDPEEEEEAEFESQVPKEVKDVEMGLRSATASPAKQAKSETSLKELKVVLDKKQTNAKKETAKKKAEEKSKKDNKEKKDTKGKKIILEEKANGPKESPKKNKKDQPKSPKKELSKSLSPAKGKQSAKLTTNDNKAKDPKNKKKSKDSKKTKEAEKLNEDENGHEIASSIVDEDDDSDKNSDKKKKKKKKKKEGAEDGKKCKKVKEKAEGDIKEKEMNVKKKNKVSTKAVKKSEKGKKTKTSKDEEKNSEKKEKATKANKKGKGKDKEKDEKCSKAKKSNKDKMEMQKICKNTKQKEKKADTSNKAKDKQPAKGKDKKTANSKPPGKKSPIKKEIKHERSVSPASSTSSDDSLSNLTLSYAILGKRTTSRTTNIRPRAPRIRRTACLNANAIVSLLYENDEPSPKRSKFDSDDSLSMEVTKEEPPKTTKSAMKQKKAASSPKKQDSVAKEKTEGKDKTTSNKKEKGKKQKGSKKPNKRATGNKVKKKTENKKWKKKEQSSDESSSDESDEEEEELRRKRKAEEDIPLWPPPKRMASLNAQAILAASKEVYRRVKVEKTSKPEVEESRNEKNNETDAVSPPKAVEEPKKSSPKENKEEDKKKAEVMPMRVPAASKAVSPEVQIVMEHRNNLPIPTQSPDVQIIEVRSPPQAPPMTQRVPPYFPGNNTRSPGSSIQPQPGPLHPQPYPLPTSNVGHYPQQPTARSHYSYPGQPMQGSPYANPPTHNPTHMQGQRYDPMPPPPSNSHYQFSSQGGPQYQRPFSGPAAAPMEPPRPSQHLGAAPAAHSKAFGTDGPASYSGLPHQNYPQQQQQQLRLQSSPTSPFQPTQPGGLGALTPLESPANNSLAGSPFHAPSTASSSSSASSQLMPQSYGQQDQQEHGFVHRSSPMGNTCTYPYPHSNGMVQQPPPHVEQYQGMPHFSAMNAMSSYQMMACHRPYGSAFSMPAFPPHLGYLQGRDEVIAADGQDMCCVQSPYSYHVHQQQVKVLVHNPGGSFHTHHHHHHHHHPLDKDGMGKDIKLGPGPSMPSIHPPGRPEPSGYYPEGYGPPRLKGKSHSSDPHQQGLRGRQQPRGIGPPLPPDREQSHSSHSSSRRSRTNAGSKRQSDSETDRSASSDNRLQSDQPTLLDLDAYKAERFRVPKSEKHSPNNNNASKFSKGEKGSDSAERASKSRADKSNIKSEKVNLRTDKAISPALSSTDSANSSRTLNIIDDSITLDRPQSVKCDRSPCVKSDRSSVRSASVKSDRSSSHPPCVKSEKNNGSRPPSVKLDKNNGSKVTDKTIIKSGKPDENSNNLMNSTKKDKMPPKVTNKLPKPANGKVITKTPMKVTTGKTEKPASGELKTVTKSDAKSAKTDKSSSFKQETSNKGEALAQTQKEKSLRLEVRISKLDQQGPEVREKTSPRHKDKAGHFSPKQKPAETLKKEVSKKKPIPCKWHWQGEPKNKRVFNPALEGQMVERLCYSAIQHVDGDIIKVRDTVLVCSGPKKTDIPYVAKIAALWERENSPGEMMMSVVWYYRPEHTEMEPEKVPKHIPCEIFASKHKDETPVACIEDKCHVLTFSEYCRFKAMIQRKTVGLPVSSEVVPQLPENEVPRRHRFPPLNASPETVFLCRKVYDFKLKRVLKNPAPS